MIATAFALWTFPFWFLLAVFFAAQLIAIEKDSPEAATLIAIAALAILQLFTDANPIGWVFQNLLAVLLGLVLYVAIGAIWSVAKWWLFLHGIRQELRKKANVRDYDIPNVAGNKSRIYLWVVYWPVSMVWSLVNEPVKRIYNFVYDLLANSYQRIVDSVFAEFKSKPGQDGERG